MFVLPAIVFGSLNPTQTSAPSLGAKPTIQTEIKELLHLPDYTISRLVSKVEDYCYIRQAKKGIENFMALETL